METASLSTIVLGRGLEVRGGDVCLSPGSAERADRATEDYYLRGEGYANGGLIICSGGHPRLDDGKEFHTSEASLMADRMIRGGVPSRVIETETESTSTFGNFLNSAPMLANREITAENPLGVVVHRVHWARARFLGGKVLRVPMQEIATRGEDDLFRSARERVMGLAWRAALAGVNDGDLEGLRAREDRVNDFAARFRPLLRHVIS